MGQVLHTNAITTHAIRKKIQEAPSSISTHALSKCYGLNYRTVKKWRERESVEDRRSGPQDPRPKSLSKVEEAAYVYFGTTTQLSLDDWLYSQQDSIPRLKRSNLHCLFQHHGNSRLPKAEIKRRRRHSKSIPLVTSMST